MACNICGPKSGCNGIEPEPSIVMLGGFIHEPHVRYRLTMGLWLWHGQRCITTFIESYGSMELALAAQKRIGQATATRPDGDRL